jgi:MFS family permease
MRKTSQFSLFSQRRFAPFFWTQFLGALNDNVFKTGVMTALTFDALHWTTMDRGFLNNLIPGLFILPFVLISAFAGQLADKFEKSCFIRRIKLLEIGIMAIAGFGWMTHNLWLLIAAVAGMGVHSALFGPVKYAYLPQKLEASELTGGNGVVEMGTFVGILLGQILGAMLVSHRQSGLELIAGGALAIALLGWICSRRIPDSPPPVPQLKINWNLFAEAARNLRFSSRNKTVFAAMLANSWFWFYGAILLAQFPVYTEAYLHGDYSIFVLLLSTFSLGVGTGSLLCERLSGHKVEIGLVPLGAIGLSLFGYDLYRASLAYGNTTAVDVFGFLQQVGSVHIVLDCLMIGIVGGIYIVPLFALVQTRCDPQHMSRTIAGMNILNALFMVAAALVAMVLLKAGLSIPQLFLLTALLNAVFALGLFIAVPEFPVSFIAWMRRHRLRRNE